MDARKGAAPDSAVTEIEGQKIAVGKRQSDKPTAQNPQAYSLHRGRSRKAIVRVIPDGPLFRVLWPDIGPSQPANLTRCMSAAREWAERSVMTEDRKKSAARRLKSLANFSWSASYVRPGEVVAKGAAAHPAKLLPKAAQSAEEDAPPTAPVIEEAVS